MGSLYRSQHELFFVFKSGAAAHINNVELGKNGRYRTNVWTYAGVNAFGVTRDDELAMHPTVKPVALVVDAILLDPLYCDVILRRLAKVAKLDAVLVETGRSFADVAADRNAANEANGDAPAANGATSQEAAE